MLSPSWIELESPGAARSLIRSRLWRLLPAPECSYLPPADVAIPAGAVQSFLITFGAYAPTIPTKVKLGYTCSGVDQTHAPFGNEEPLGAA